MAEDWSGKLEEAASIFERYANVPDVEREAAAEARKTAAGIRSQLERIEVALEEHEKRGGELDTGPSPE